MSIFSFRGAGEGTQVLSVRQTSKRCTYELPAQPKPTVIVFWQTTLKLDSSTERRMVLHLEMTFLGFGVGRCLSRLADFGCRREPR